MPGPKPFTSPTTAALGGEMGSDRPRTTVGPRDIPQGLTRESREQDQFYIDPRSIPDGWSYEWKRESTYNEPDPHHMQNLRANHWEVVPVERHPEFASFAGTDGAIRIKGLVLCERPAYLTQDAKQEGYDEAMGRLQSNQTKIRETPADSFQRVRGGGINRTFGPPQYAEEK